MRRIFVFKFLVLLLPLGAVADTSTELEELLYTSIDFYDQLLRRSNGIYRSGYELDGSHSVRASVATQGIGLMALCMNYELGRDQEAVEKALQTLRALNGKTPGLNIDRDSSGFFVHFFNSNTGDGHSEYSTIDTSILMSGALCCRNTFDDIRIRNEVDELFHSIQWSKAIYNAEKMQFYQTMKNGRGQKGGITTLFNEYLILAWYIDHEQTLKEGDSEVMPEISDLPVWKHRGLEFPVDREGHALSSFVIQFPFYMMADCQESPEYLEFMKNYAFGDWKTSSEINDDKYLWGCGAGSTPEHGYVASNFLNNPDNMVSPRTIAGFMPVSKAAVKTILYFLSRPERCVETPVGILLPRFSLDHPEWKPKHIESIDFSSMLFGTAAMHPDLGTAFFREKMMFTVEALPTDRGKKNRPSNDDRSKNEID